MIKPAPQIEELNGQTLVTFANMTDEHYEMLRALQASPHWHFYRLLLRQSKEAYFNSTLAVDDPNKVMKQMGMVAGINYSLNQIDAIVANHDAKKKRDASKKLNKQEKAILN